MKSIFCIIVMSLLVTGCQSTPAKLSGDEAIRRVDACECYRSVEGQKQKPWDLKWDDTEMLRQQFSHCVCRADIDLRSVEDPGRYVVPGTVVK